MRTDRRAPSGSTPRGPKPRQRLATPVGIVLPPNTELISGRNTVREALRAARRVRRLLVARDGRRDPLVEDAVASARQEGIPVDEVEEHLLSSLAPDHQGLAALVAPFPYLGWGSLLARLEGVERPPAVLLLDTLQDPQNLGTLLRTAEATAVDAVVLPKRRAVHVTPAVVRSSAGAVEHLTVAQVPNLTRAARDLKEAGLWVVGIDMDGDRPYWDVDLVGPTVLVLGGEDRGIGRLLKESCDHLVRLPMVGKVGSLNVAVAGSVVLYEMVRQRVQAGIWHQAPGNRHQ